MLSTFKSVFQTPIGSEITRTMFNQLVVNQGCQIFIDTIYQNGGNIIDAHKYNKLPWNKVPKWPQSVPNGHRSYLKNFHPNAFKNLPKLGDLVWKRTIWQPWLKCQYLNANILGRYNCIKPWSRIRLSNSFKQVNMTCFQGDQGPMLWFFKYFRRKIRRKNWRFWLKTKLKYSKFWS
jgi:hypothetical protein